MKEVVYGYKGDIVGLFWLALAFFLSLALSSYYPLDPSFNSMSTFVSVQNKCGILGSFIADFLYQFFGISSWGFVFIFLRQSMMAFKKKLFFLEFKTNAFLLILGLFISSSLLELHQPGKKIFEGYIYYGGIVGKEVINSAYPYLHFSGLILVFWSLALIFCLLITQSSIMHLSLRIFNFLQLIGGKSVKILLITTTNIFRKLPLVCRTPLFFFRQSKATSSKESLAPKEDLVSPSDFLSDKQDYCFKENSNLDPIYKQSSVNILLDKKWKIPSINLLSAVSTQVSQISSYEMQGDAERLQRKLRQFSIDGEVTNILSGPVITLFEFKPEASVKVARITQMEDDLMIALKSKSIRIIAPIPGRDVVGIEADHSHRQIVDLKPIIKDSAFAKNDFSLPLVLGRHIDGRVAIHDLGKIPHLMVAGSTGSGKSVFVISLLLSWLFRYTPNNLRLLLVDPKQVDLSVFKGLPHLLASPVREAKQAVLSLQWCINEMYKRYRSLARFYVRDLEGFNTRTQKLSAEEIKKHKHIVESLGEDSEENYYYLPQPYICIVLEEFGDLMSSPERSHIENLVVRLAQMARACGMHLILSMQSPRKDVVTGLIKTNIPGRISFKVSSRIDSRIILDEGGAERLLSQGDMLYLGPGYSKPQRFHGPFVKEKDVISVVEFWKQQITEDPYIIKFSSQSNINLKSTEEFFLSSDQKYTEIFTYVSDLKEVSASHLQRKYGLGYPRAARLIDQLEEKGVVGPSRGSKPREVLSHNK